MKVCCLVRFWAIEIARNIMVVRGRNPLLVQTGPRNLESQLRIFGVRERAKENFMLGNVGEKSLPALSLPYVLRRLFVDFSE